MGSVVIQLYAGECTPSLNKWNLKRFFFRSEKTWWKYLLFKFSISISGGLRKDPLLRETTQCIFIFFVQNYWVCRPILHVEK